MVAVCNVIVMLTAFTELQTDMTEMTADIAALHGLPFFEYNSYCMKVLFPTQNENDHPVMRRLEVVYKNIYHSTPSAFGPFIRNIS